MMNWIFFAGKPLDAAEAMRGSRIRDAPIPAETNSRRETLTMLNTGAVRDVSVRAYLQRVRKPRPMDSAAWGEVHGTEDFLRGKHHISAEGALRLSYHVVLSEPCDLFVIVG